MSRNTAEVTRQQERTVNLTESEWHSLLRSEHRRVVLDVLDDHPTELQLVDVATEVAKREAGLDAADRETVTRLKTSLHHNHLPKMDQLGVLTYDPETNQIRR